MIAALHGTVLEKSEDEAIIEVAGVGYRVAFSVLTLSRLPPAGEPVRVRVRTVVREDALELFGFLTAGRGGDVHPAHLGAPMSGRSWR